MLGPERRGWPRSVGARWRVAARDSGGDAETLGRRPWQPARVPAPIFDEPTVVPARAGMTARQWRDLIGLALVIIGVLGLVVSAWLWHPLAGLAATSAAVVAAGIALGYDW